MNESYFNVLVYINQPAQLSNSPVNRALSPGTSSLPKMAPAWEANLHWGRWLDGER